MDKIFDFMQRRPGATFLISGGLTIVMFLGATAVIAIAVRYALHG